MKQSGLTVLLLASLVLIVGCQQKSYEMIKIDGSSTVYPISEAVAEEFSIDLRKADRGGEVRVIIGVSGTGGGFEKFCRGETDVTGASRPIKPVEMDACRAAGIGFIELPVAYDGVTVVVNPTNDWVDQLTTDELERIWEPAAQQTIMKWSDVRPGWPDRKLSLYGAGVDSGTYDYFTEAIMGESGKSRGDFTSSEDDNVLVQGVAGDENALGFFGFAYFKENQSRVHAVPIASGDGAAVEPTVETIASSTYVPLSRPIFIYVSLDAAKRPAMQEFIEYYLTEGRSLVEEVGYIEMPDRAYELALERFRRRTTGSVFDGHGSSVGVSAEELLSRERDSEPPSDHVVEEPSSSPSPDQTTEEDAE